MVLRPPLRSPPRKSTLRKILVHVLRRLGRAEVGPWVLVEVLDRLLHLEEYGLYHEVLAIRHSDNFLSAEVHAELGEHPLIEHRPVLYLDGFAAGLHVVVDVDHALVLVVEVVADHVRHLAAVGEVAHYVLLGSRLRHFVNPRVNGFKLAVC